MTVFLGVASVSYLCALRGFTTSMLACIVCARLVFNANFSRLQVSARFCESVNSDSDDQSSLHQLAELAVSEEMHSSTLPSFPQRATRLPVAVEYAPTVPADGWLPVLPTFTTRVPSTGPPLPVQHVSMHGPFYPPPPPAPAMRSTQSGKDAVRQVAQYQEFELIADRNFAAVIAGLPLPAVGGSNHAFTASSIPSTVRAYVAAKEIAIDNYLQRRAFRRFHLVPPDGNCLYHTFSFFTGINHEDLRWLAAIWVDLHSTDRMKSGQTLAEALSNARAIPWHQVMISLRTDRKYTYSEYPVVLALARMLHLPCVILNCDNAHEHRWAFTVVTTDSYEPALLNPTMRVLVYYSKHYCPTFLNSPLAPLLQLQSVDQLAAEAAETLRSLPPVRLQQRIHGTADLTWGHICALRGSEAAMSRFLSENLWTSLDRSVPKRPGKDTYVGVFP